MLACSAALCVATKNVKMPGAAQPPLLLESIAVCTTVRTHTRASKQSWRKVTERRRKGRKGKSGGVGKMPGWKKYRETDSTNFFQLSKEKGRERGREKQEKGEKKGEVLFSSSLSFTSLGLFGRRRRGGGQREGRRAGWVSVKCPHLAPPFPPPPFSLLLSLFAPTFEGGKRNALSPLPTEFSVFSLLPSFLRIIKFYAVLSGSCLSDPQPSHLKKKKERFDLFLVFLHFSMNA